MILLPSVVGYREVCSLGEERGKRSLFCTDNYETRSLFLLFVLMRREVEDEVIYCSRTPIK